METNNETVNEHNVVKKPTGRSQTYVIFRLGGPYSEKLWPRSQFFSIRTDPKPANNMFIFFFSCGKVGFTDYKWVCLRNFVIESTSAPSTDDL